MICWRMRPSLNVIPMEWKCNKCTYNNNTSAHYCIMCNSSYLEQENDRQQKERLDKMKKCNKLLVDGWIRPHSQKYKLSLNQDIKKDKRLNKLVTFGYTREFEENEKLSIPVALKTLITVFGNPYYKYGTNDLTFAYYHTE